MPPQSRYDIQKIRNEIKKRMQRDRDPNEFRPPKAEEGKSYKFRFFILPPYFDGDVIENGKCTVGPDESMSMYFVPTGTHFMENQRYGCPRCISEEPCELCNYGFALMQEIDNSTKEGKDKRSAIARDFLAKQYYKVNIYFPPIDTNPEEYRGRVMWYDAPGTIFDIWQACLGRDDDGGDKEEPMAFGVFFDELDAYLFQLEVKLHGRGNDYKLSKFLVSQTSSSRPLVVKNGKASEEHIKAILKMRHNLHSKLPRVDLNGMEQLVAKLQGNSPTGFDHDETKSAPQKAAKSTKSTKTAKVVEEKVEDTPIEDDKPLAPPDDDISDDATFDDEQPVEDDKPVIAGDDNDGDDDTAQIDKLLASLNDD